MSGLTCESADLLWKVFQNRAELTLNPLLPRASLNRPTSSSRLMDFSVLGGDPGHLLERRERMLWSSQAAGDVGFNLLMEIDAFAIGTPLRRLFHIPILATAPS